MAVGSGVTVGSGAFVGAGVSVGAGASVGAAASLDSSFSPHAHKRNIHKNTAVSIILFKLFTSILLSKSFIVQHSANSCTK